MRKWSHRILVLGAVFCCVALVYIGFFVGRFDVLGYAVRDNEHGWLGPPMRNNSRVIDIGKVYYYEGTDFSLYRWYRPLCVLWLRFWGVTD